jgi:RecJ-like exonuclease
MMRLSVFVIPMALLSIVSVAAAGEISISALRAAAESSNLELVTLQGTVRLTRPHRQQLGGTCGATAFTLVDDTGSIEVTVRRAGRLVEPLRDGDHVQVMAQVHVFRNKDQLPILICIAATDIQHLPN